MPVRTNFFYPIISFLTYCSLLVLATQMFIELIRANVYSAIQHLIVHRHTRSLVLLFLALRSCFFILFHFCCFLTSQGRFVEKQIGLLAAVAFWQTSSTQSRTPIHTHTHSHQLSESLFIMRTAIFSNLAVISIFQAAERDVALILLIFGHFFCKFIRFVW